MASSRCCVNTSTQFYTVIFTTRKSSCGKVMFSQACVIPSVWGDGVSLHAMGQAEVCIPACNGVGVNFWYDLLLWPSGVAVCHGLMDRPLSGLPFCYGLLEWPSAMAFWCGLLCGLLVWPSVMAFWWPSVMAFWCHLLYTPHPMDIPQTQWWTSRQYASCWNAFLFYRSQYLSVWTLPEEP